MEFAIPGFIKRYCTPNALSTLMEYLVDYASPATREAGLRVVDAELAKLGADPIVPELKARLERIRTGNERDLYV
jgi:2-iminoacetate synthase